MGSDLHRAPVRGVVEPCGPAGAHVAAARAELEAAGVVFEGDTFDTGVCHMALFADPDGNAPMLHRRLRPPEAPPAATGLPLAI